MILRQQTSKNTGAQLTLFPEASPASPSALLGNERERQTTVSSGRKCLELYGRFSRCGSSLRTLAASLLSSEAWYSSACALNWRMQGTKFNRLLFRLAPLVRRTAEKESGLLPTPTAFMPMDKDDVDMGMKAKGLSPVTNPLSVFAVKELLPTPTASDRLDGIPISRKSPKLMGTPNLSSFAASGLLPTPEASNFKNGHKTMSHRIQRKLMLGRTIGLNDLATLKLLPTPLTTKASRQDNLNKTFQAGGTSQLNPLFVAEMMGFPPDWTVLPFLLGDEDQ